MPSSHLSLCRPLLLLPPILRVYPFQEELDVRGRRGREDSHTRGVALGQGGMVAQEEMLNVQGWGSHLETGCLNGVDKGDCGHGLGHSRREDKGQNDELFPTESLGLWFDEQLAKKQSPDLGSAQVSTPAKY